MPEIWQPEYFGTDELKFSKGNRVRHEDKFRDFREKNPQGYFLFGEFHFFHIVRVVGNYSALFIYLTDRNVIIDIDSLIKDVPEIVEILSSSCSLFGFAACESEVKHRNYHVYKIEDAEVSGYIGEDIGKYIPGLYWNTILSEEIIDMHNIDIRDLTHNTLAHKLLCNGKQHLFTFFDKPTDWTFHAGKLDQICDQTKGIFSRSAVDKELSEVKNLNEYLDVVDKWP